MARKARGALARADVRAVLARAEALVKRLRRAGWKRGDFKRGLARMLGRA